MKAIDTELTKFLGAEAQYYVPIYQRKYSWKKDNCLKLIDDILKVAKDNESHLSCKAGRDACFRSKGIFGD